MNNSINISLPKQLADTVRAQVKAGHFASVSEVVQQALHKFFVNQPDVPTFKMSKKAEKVAQQALQDYKNGKAIPVASFVELEKQLASK
ncbi:TPA: hypothetical protein DIV55_00120 [Patescibacteria group bacterium]|uniref:Uncharacterized protein n=1 Tax=Candidatus Gottesmanbacteria bacterium GW2011_GWA1_43_11 TaxID=1618436 RepID=A0A0G1CKP0_9BACT|nr:MAG: hypothetical protein UV59_C0003G0052 [Candidatus Gottesmanbacteria bacterium GW2011_GWA1_43_11]HCS78132.1 hypothetical protein [Patescibacteria group bacterium]